MITYRTAFHRLNRPQRIPPIYINLSQLEAFQVSIDNLKDKIDTIETNVSEKFDEKLKPTQEILGQEFPRINSLLQGLRQGILLPPVESDVEDDCIKDAFILLRMMNTLEDQVIDKTFKVGTKGNSERIEGYRNVSQGAYQESLNVLEKYVQAQQLAGEIKDRFEELFIPLEDDFKQRAQRSRNIQQFRNEVLNFFLSKQRHQITS